MQEHQSGMESASDLEDAWPGFLIKNQLEWTHEKRRRTLGVRTLHIELVDVFHHPEQQDSCFRMFRVRNDVVESKTVEDDGNRILEIGERVEVAS